MSDHIKATIDDLQRKLREHEGKVTDTKRLINMLCESVGMPTLYDDADTEASASTMRLRRDQFYGRGISTAMREYLEMRRAGNQGPATVNEIYEALYDGGFKFESKDAKNAKRGIRISLTKNTSIFHRLPDGRHFGLAKWYPDIKDNGAPNGIATKKAAVSASSGEDVEGGDDDD